jgi:hypothetical protein
LPAKPQNKPMTVALSQAYLQAVSICGAEAEGSQCLLVASPLHSKQEHSDTGREQEESDKVEPVVQIFDDFRRLGLDDLAFRNLAEEDQGGDNRAWREIDVETPTPAVK